MTKKEEIIKYLEENPEASTSQIAIFFGVSSRYARELRAQYAAKEKTPAFSYVEPVECSDIDTELKLDQMIGAKKSTIPYQKRKFIAETVREIEKALDRVPLIEVESSGDKESAVLLIGDIHAGKLAFDDRGNVLYNKDICAFRLSLLKTKLIKILTKHLRPNTVDEVVICLLGDIVDGSGIYSGQEHNQDMHWIIDQIAVSVAGIWEIVRGVRSELKLPVRVKAVPGNHGRQGKEMPAQNNFDYFVYQNLYMLAHLEKDEGVTVEYPQNAIYLNFPVKGHNVHIRHQAPPQAETAAARAKYGAWQHIHDWDIFCLGHLHHPGNPSYLTSDVFMNGSPVGMDDYAEGMAVVSRPSQTLFGVDPGIGVSFTYKLYLDKATASGGEADELLTKYPVLKQ